jgi:hypothetical protein
VLSYIKEQLALWRFKRSPLAQAIRAHTQEYFYGNTALSSFNQESKERLIGDFCQKAGAVYLSPNPILACRETQAEYVLLFAQLQVLCLTEGEKLDQFYSGNPYISGQLWRHIREASEHHDELAKAKWETPDLTDEELVAFANARCALLLYYANGFNIVRRELGDMADQKDWFRPFVEACLINEEHQIREKIDLPPLIPGALGSLVYSAFVNYVINGEPNPFFSWTRDFPDAYLAGEGPTPKLVAAP